MHLFLENEASLDFENLFNNRNNGYVALLADRGHGVNWLADSDTFDFNFFTVEQLVDCLLTPASGPRDLNAPTFDSALSEGKLFLIKRNTSLVTRFRGFGSECT